MTTAIEEFRLNGYVLIEEALDPDFCDEVVGRRFFEMGWSGTDASTWPKGRVNLPATTAFPMQEVAPRACNVMHELVGGADRVRFGGLPDNLIVNFPDPDATWWPPAEALDHLDGWHKDGDWFRHFLDSGEQALLGIIMWEDVIDDQGPTYAALDSISLVARLLADRPAGLDGGIPKSEVSRILTACTDFAALTGPKGAVAWCHPFLLHTASVNALPVPRIISNTSVMLTEPLEFSGPRRRSPVELSILNALGVDELDFEPERPRAKIESERQRRWDAGTALH